MRTVIFMGLLAIADAINKDWLTDTALPFYIGAFILALLGDLYVTLDRKRNK